MLRIDELAELGCCCFCTVLYIGNETFLTENPEKVGAEIYKFNIHFVVSPKKCLFRLGSQVHGRLQEGNGLHVAQPGTGVCRANGPTSAFEVSLLFGKIDFYSEKWLKIRTPVNKQIFERSFAYFSESLENVERDWTKVLFFKYLVNNNNNNIRNKYRILHVFTGDKLRKETWPFHQQ
jgi:pyrimidine precursor biosynthesis enzyme